MWVEILAGRGDVVALHDIYVRAARNIVTVLLALNRVYHPGFKWLDRTIEELSLQPPGLAVRLHRLFQAPPRQGARELKKLVEETFSLVEVAMPGIDTAPIQQRFRHRRAAWQSPPPHLFEGS
jgi:hypothetical protein